MIFSEGRRRRWIIVWWQHYSLSALIYPFSFCFLLLSSTGTYSCWQAGKDLTSCHYCDYLAASHLNFMCWTLLKTWYRLSGNSQYWWWLLVSSIKLHHIRRKKKMNHCMVAAFIVCSSLFCCSRLVASVKTVVNTQVRFWLVTIVVIALQHHSKTSFVT